ncbi:MAG: XrtA/PEP-CTERM system exopolysaccharide export protein [Gammaproteobacteria bacterium]
MKASPTTRYPFRPWLILTTCLTTAACGWLQSGPTATAVGSLQGYEYLIAPGDTLSVFVWQNPDVSVGNVPVRPDGKISTPLVEDMTASGKTSKQLGQDIAAVLTGYIKDPSVTVTVTRFVGGYAQQVRVVGEAVKPLALPYRQHMTLLDVMIQVQGLTPYADGNKAKLVRRVGEQDVETRIRLEDLVKNGDMSANLEISPGDVIIIPEAWF